MLNRNTAFPGPSSSATTEAAPIWPAALALVLIGLLAHGIYLAKLGYYWDDWPVVWVFGSHGREGIVSYFAGERPVQAWFYGLAASCLGLNPIGWQLAGFISRCAASVFLFVGLGRAWPARRDIAWLAAAFALLYPGFAQQSIAFTFLPHNVSLMFFAISLAATVGALTESKARWALYAVSLLAAAPAYTITEYFVGLEVLRLGILLFRADGPVAPGGPATKKGMFLLWLPNAAVWIACIAWRAFFNTASYYGNAHNYKDVSTEFSRIVQHPLPEILGRANAALHNVALGGMFAWLRPFDPRILLDWHSRSVLLSWVLGLLAAGVALLAVRRLSRESAPATASGPAAPPSAWLREPAFVLGLIAVAVTGLPLVPSGLKIQFTESPPFDDRFSLPFLVGSSLAMAGLWSLLSGARRLRAFVLAALVFASCVFHIEHANRYRHDWAAQRDLFWQIAWRLPGLPPGTSVFVDGLPYTLYRNHTAGVLDMLYGVRAPAGRLDYFIFDLPWLVSDQLSYAGGKLSFLPGQPIAGQVRTFRFEGNTSRAVVAWISPSGTLRVLDRARVNDIVGLSPACREVAGLSQPETLTGANAGPPGGTLLTLFGAEPPHGWTYYFQRAEFERQSGHWDAVDSLGDEAVRAGCEPADPSEQIPFVEAYARTGRIEMAVQLTGRILDRSPISLTALSGVWQRILDNETARSQVPPASLALLRTRLQLSE